MIVFAGAGGRGGEGRLTVDGLNIGSTVGGGGSTSLIVDISNAEEVVITNSGGLGEMEVGGPSLNVVPKTGGNSVKGSAYLSGVPKGWVASNYSDTLRDAGLSTPGALLKQWDFDAGVGGPIKKDKLWYFVTARDEGQHRSIPGHLSEPERRRPDQVPLRARHHQTDAGGGELAGRNHPPDVAGDAAQQVQRLLERATAVQWGRVQQRLRRVPSTAGIWRDHRGAEFWRLDRHDITGNRGVPAHDWGPLPAVHLDVAGDESDPRGDRFREHARALGSTGYAGEPDAGTWPAPRSSARQAAPQTEALQASPTARRTG